MKYLIGIGKWIFWTGVIYLAIAVSWAEWDVRNWHFLVRIFFAVISISIAGGFLLEDDEKK